MDLRLPFLVFGPRLLKLIASPMAPCASLKFCSRTCAAQPQSADHHVILLRRFAVIAVGGVLGSWMRWRLSVWFPVASGTFPTTTLAINLVGSALIGVVLVLFLDRQPPRLLTHSFLGTGILGAFTTFSTFTVESAELLRQSKPLTALAYVIVSVVGGVFVAMTSMRLTRRVVHLEVAS
jgi:CrcB protein